jgi:hypothetical protein
VLKVKSDALNVVEVLKVERVFSVEFLVFELYELLTQISLIRFSKPLTSLKKTWSFSRTTFAHNKSNAVSN